MQYKLYIDIGLKWPTGLPMGYMEVKADIVSPFTLSKEKPSAGTMEQHFYRFVWGELKLSNKARLFQTTDMHMYRIFDYIQGMDFTTKILVKHETSLRTIYGYFGKNDCKFDFDTKTISVTPAIIDRYTDILENWETEVDVTTYKGNETSITINVPVDTLRTINDWSSIGTSIAQNKVKNYRYRDNNSLYLFFGEDGIPNNSLYSDSYWGFGANSIIYKDGIQYGTGSYTLTDRIAILGQTPSTDKSSVNYGPALDLHYGDYELSKFRVYEGELGSWFSGSWRTLYNQTWFTREEITKLDVADANSDWGFVSPVGKGWNMRAATKMQGKDAHIWTRKPFNGAFSGNWELSDLMPSTESASWPWNFSYLESEIHYASSISSTTTNRSSNLRDLLKYLLNNSGQGDLLTKNIRSTFFFNDDENLVPVLDGHPGINYVTGLSNYLNNTKTLFIKDIAIPDLSNTKPPEKYTIKFKDAIDELNKLFCNTLIWFIDDEGVLRIEHIKYIELTATYLDVSEDKLLVETSKWSFDKTNSFEKFTYTQQNAGNADFIDNVVTFNQIVSSNRNTDLSSETKGTLFSTDASYCFQNPNDLDDTGILLLCLNNAGDIISTIGRISGTTVLNSPLSISNLLYDFRRYEGVDYVGMMNNMPVTFTVTTRNKLGVELMLPGTLDNMFYITQIGYGQIVSGQVDFDREFTKISLRYRNNSGIASGRQMIVFQKQSDFLGAQNIAADISNYTIIQ